MENRKVVMQIAQDLIGQPAKRILRQSARIASLYAKHFVELSFLQFSYCGILSTFYVVGFCPLFMLWDFVLWDFVLWDFVRRDFVLWDFVLWDSVPDSVLV